MLLDRPDMDEQKPSETIGKYNPKRKREEAGAGISLGEMIAIKTKEALADTNPAPDGHEQPQKAASCIAESVPDAQVTFLV